MIMTIITTVPLVEVEGSKNNDNINTSSSECTSFEVMTQILESVKSVYPIF